MTLTKAGKMNEALCREVYDLSLSDFYFYRYFIQDPPPSEGALA
ncbi:MAG: hypothetical protein AB9873_03215 [Syntrophobacteraceae bacterium]